MEKPKGTHRRARFAWAADLGGTKIAVARVGGDGEITHRFLSPTPEAGGDAVVRALADQLQRLPIGGVRALGIAVPGLVYRDGSVWAPNLAGWKRMPVREMLARRFKLPTIVESDRNAFVTGEAWKGVAENRRDVVFLAIGTGIGAGIISGGRLLRGYGDLSGCAGWMAVRNRFLPGYAKVGCLEYYAAGPGIEREARRILGRLIRTREIVQLARAGDRRAESVITRAGETLGLALANLVNLLDPEMIVIGGGVAAAGNLLLEPARKTMVRWAQPLSGRRVRIRRSRLGERACLLGAAQLAFNHIGDTSTIDGEHPPADNL